MNRFFPSSEQTRQARRSYASGNLKEPWLAFERTALELPTARVWRDMIEEFCLLVDRLGVPDRDGADVGVIVPVRWDGVETKRLISIDFGRQALAFARQTDSGPNVPADEVFAEDPDLAGNLRDALLPLLVTYKNGSGPGSYEPES